MTTYVLTSTTGEENDSCSSFAYEVESYWKTSTYYVIIDSVISNFKYL